MKIHFESDERVLGDSDFVESVQTNLELIKSGKLPEFGAAMTCAGHPHGGGCAHH